MLKKITSHLGGVATRLRKNLAIVVVVIPMLVLTVYYLAIVSDRYLSESKLVVKRSSDAVSQLGGLSIPLLGSLGGASNEDALYLREYILSPDLIAKLDKELNLRDEFSTKGIDFFSALPPWASKEDFVKHFRKRVEVGYDEKTGVMTVRTLASSPDFSQQMNLAILRESENFINELSHKIAREQNEFANQELLRAKKGLDEARERLLAYQNNQKLLDPTASAEVASRVVAELEAQLTSKEVEYRALGGTLQDDAAQMVTLRQAIGSLKTQIDREKKKLTSPQEVALNRSSATYLEYKQLVDFQIELYKLSLTSVEKMRVEAARKLKTLAILSKPQIPEEAEFPHRAYLLIVWLFSLCMLFGFVRLTLEIIEDHRD